jgi:hypothetical protein
MGRRSLAVVVVGAVLLGVLGFMLRGAGEDEAGTSEAAREDAAVASAAEQRALAPAASVVPAASPVASSTAAAAAPTPAPPDRATLTLMALADAQVTVAVDSATVFAGTLRAGEQSSWEGSSRVQVSTSSGRNIAVTVNGYSLGPLSLAVGHPEWNHVDWGWFAGWSPR